MRTFSFDSNKARDYYWSLRENFLITFDEKITMHSFICEVRKVVIDCNDEIPNYMSLSPISNKYEKSILDFFKYMGYENVTIQFLTQSTIIRIEKV